MRSRSSNATPTGRYAVASPAKSVVWYQHVHREWVDEAAAEDLDVDISAVIRLDERRPGRGTVQPMETPS